MTKQIEEMSRIASKCITSWLNNETPKTSPDYIAERLYNAGYRKQEWISVEERLPDRNGRYLTHCNVEGQSLVCILYFCKVGGFDEGTVTHWMSLPEAPEMKGGEGNENTRSD